MSFLSPSGGRDYARLLASPAALLPSPLAHGLFSPGADATQVVKDGRLSFDVLLQEPQEGEEGGAAALEGLVAPQLKGAGDADRRSGRRQPATRRNSCRI